MTELGRVIPLFTEAQQTRNARRADETVEALERAAELGAQILEAIDELKDMAKDGNVIVQDATDAILRTVRQELPPV